MRAACEKIYPNELVNAKSGKQQYHKKLAQKFSGCESLKEVCDFCYFHKVILRECLGRDNVEFCFCSVRKAFEPVNTIFWKMSLPAICIISDK